MHYRTVKKIASRLCFLSVYNEYKCEKQIRGFTIKRGLFIVLNRETFAHSRCLIARSIFDKVAE